MKSLKFLVILTAVGCLTGWVGSTEVHAQAAKSNSVSVVTLTIDYSDGVQKHFTAIAWQEGLTVQDAMRAAESHRRGIRCEFSGSGASAMLKKIDDVANQGQGSNWLYRVNGKRGEVGCGVRKLQAGDTVLWKFE